VIFSATTDGHLRAYRAEDGLVLWKFDTNGQTYHAIDGVSHQPGGPIDVSSGAVADSIVCVISGYQGSLGGTLDNVLLAFSVHGQ
jgi:glucose dehydrogenase